MIVAISYPGMAATTSIVEFGTPGSKFFPPPLHAGLFFQCNTCPLETPQRYPPKGPLRGYSAADSGCSAAGNGHTAPESGCRVPRGGYAAGRGLPLASSFQDVLPLPRVGTAFAIDAARITFSQAIS